jgi:Flp pilus assembly protein TadD
MKILLSALVFTGLLFSQEPAVAAGSGDSEAAAESSLFQTGRSAVKAERFSDAVEIFMQVTAEEPKNADAWNYLGFSSRKLKRFADAEKFYLKALALAPAHLGANEYLGELYLQTNRLAKAEERLAVLDRACLFGCEEYDQLKDSIAAFKKTGKSRY